MGFAGATIQARSSTTGEALAGRIDQQRYLQALSPISADLQLSALHMGLAAALFESEDIDGVELKHRLDAAIAVYRSAEDRLGTLQPPPALESVHLGYLDAVRLLHRAAREMVLVYDDGDDAHITFALPLVMDATARLHTLGEAYWPARVG